VRGQLHCDLRIASFEPVSGRISLEPVPGCLSLSIGKEFTGALFGLVRGNQSNVSAQIASKFALESFITGIDSEELNAENCVHDALREANRRVFEYSARMFASSRINTTGMLAVFDGVHCCVARTGDEEGYLVRAGELTPLFRADNKSRIERFIGANKNLLADISTLNVQPGDVIWMTNCPVPSLRTVADLPFDNLFAEGIAAELANRLSKSTRDNVICAAMLFDEPPITLRNIVSG
jgi:hypothetical protein